eukprot:sb/3463414/
MPKTETSKTSSAERFVKESITSNKVVAFIGAQDPFSHRALSALRRCGVRQKMLTRIVITDVDQEETIRDCFLEITDGRSTPRVFLNGKFIGGASDLEGEMLQKAILGFPTRCINVNIVWLDMFVNGLVYPVDIKLFTGIIDKVKHSAIIQGYMGKEFKTRSSSRGTLSWEVIRQAVRAMFTNHETERGVQGAKQSFYGNDALSVFKYFVLWSEPQAGFVWGLCLAIHCLCFLACWVPFLVCCVLHTAEVVDMTEWYSTFSIAIMPLNSVLNPIGLDGGKTNHFWLNWSSPLFKKGYNEKNYIGLKRCGVRQKMLTRIVITDVDQEETIRDCFLEITDGRSTPRVFLNGKFIGGASDLEGEMLQKAILGFPTRCINVDIVWLDMFVNGLVYPVDIKLFTGIIDKVKHSAIIQGYMGKEFKTRSSSRGTLSWEVIRQAVRAMFTNHETERGGQGAKQAWYGNDALSVFKYFVLWSEPQAGFVWGLCLAIHCLCFLACWVPFLVCCVLHTAEVVDMTEWYSTFSIAIMPLNSVLNPIGLDGGKTNHFWLNWSSPLFKKGYNEKNYIGLKFINLSIK